MNAILQHPAVFSIAAYWVFSAIVGGMPDPEVADGRGYKWAYKSLHILAGNISDAFTRRYPALPAGAEQKTSILQVTKVPDPPQGANQ